MVNDPVCGMEVDPKITKYSMEYKGNTYYFCSEKCLSSFTSNPEKYLEENQQSHSHGRKGGMGCCGGGGKMGYLHLILMGLFVIVLIVRTLWG